jgi:hypothetical protein
VLIVGEQTKSHERQTKKSPIAGAFRDLGDGSGTFVRIDNSKDLILKHGFIISYGDSHMVV